MKALLVLLAGLLACPVLLAEDAKPQVKLSVKRQVLDSDHDLRRKQGSTAEKIITLRVEVANVTATALAASELSGAALVLRASGEKERLVKETLGKVAVPALKPNEKTVVDLGKITLTELEWGKQKFEEKLEEWKVTCTAGQIVLGTELSSDQFAAREKTAAAKAKEIPQNPTKKRIKRLAR